MAAKKAKKPKKAKPLSHKQKAFVREYLIDFNATAAYKRAGYKCKSDEAAKSASSRMLTNVNVQAEIQAGVKKHADASGLTVDRIWEEWRRIGLADIGDIIDFTGTNPRLKPANEISEDARRAIASVKVKRYVEGHGDEAKTVEIMDFKLWDKPGTLRDAAKARELFKERLEVSGEIEIANIQVITTKARDERVLPDDSQRKGSGEA